jgi:hypothetical protein
MSTPDLPRESTDAVLSAVVHYKRGGTLGLRIKEHWRKYRPRMFKELVRAGKLDEAVRQAEEMTISAYDQAIGAGLAPDQARELVSEEWALLPDEETSSASSPSGARGTWRTFLGRSAAPGVPRAHDSGLERSTGRLNAAPQEQVTTTRAPSSGETLSHSPQRSCSAKKAARSPSRVTRPPDPRAAGAIAGSQRRAPSRS